MATMRRHRHTPTLRPRTILYAPPPAVDKSYAPPPAVAEGDYSPADGDYGEYPENGEYPANGEYGEYPPANGY